MSFKRPTFEPGSYKCNYLGHLLNSEVTHVQGLDRVARSSIVHMSFSGSEREFRVTCVQLLS